MTRKKSRGEYIRVIDGHRRYNLEANWRNQSFFHRFKAYLAGIAGAGLLFGGMGMAVAYVDSRKPALMQTYNNMLKIDKEDFGKQSPEELETLGESSSQDSDEEVIQAGQHGLEDKLDGPQFKNLSIEGIKKIIDEECKQYNSGRDGHFRGYKVDPILFTEIVRTESNFRQDIIHYKVKRVRNPDWAKNARFRISNRGVKEFLHLKMHDKRGREIPAAYGLCGLTPKTAKDVGIDSRKIMDSRQNIRGGIRYFGKLLQIYEGEKIKAIAAYNAGPSRVTYKLPKIEQTREYVKRILSAYSAKTGKKQP
jgi:hypothetical protein